MSGGVIHYMQFSCPSCGKSFSNNAIAMAHVQEKCPFCGSPVRIDANKAIPNTLESKLGGGVVFVGYLMLLWIASAMLDIDVDKFFTSLSVPLRFVFIGCVLLPAFFLMSFVERLDKKSLARSLTEEE